MPIKRPVQKFVTATRSCSLSTIADFVELTSLMGVVTREEAHTNAVVGKLIKSVALSGHIAADGAFARQVRRKHV